MEERVTTVKRTRALEQLRKNREKHQKEYIAAVIGHKKYLTKQLKTELKRLQACSPSDKFSLDMGLHTSPPTHHLQDYDTYITMLDWEIDDDVDLSIGEFNNFIMDNWSWKNNWDTTFSFYADVDDLRPE